MVRIKCVPSSICGSSMDFDSQNRDQSVHCASSSDSNRSWVVHCVTCVWCQSDIFDINVVNPSFEGGLS